MSRDRLKSVWAAHPAPTADDGPVRTIAYAHMPAPSPRRSHSYSVSDAPGRVARPSLVPTPSNGSSRAVRPSLVPSIYSSYGDESVAGYDDMGAFWHDLRDIQAWIAQLAATIDQLAHHQSSSLSVLPDTPAGQRIAGEIEVHVKGARATMQQVRAAATCIRAETRATVSAAKSMRALADTRPDQNLDSRARAHQWPRADRVRLAAKAQSDGLCQVRERASERA